MTKGWIKGLLVLSGAWAFLVCGVLAKIRWFPSTWVGWTALMASGPPVWIALGVLSDILLGQHLAKRLPSWLLLLTGVSVLLVGLFYGALGLKHIMLIDDCLGQGHRWDYQHDLCEQ